MIYGMDITNTEQTPPPQDRRVLVWSRSRWKPAQWEAGLHGGAWFLDCGTGPIKFTHWCHMPPNPED